MPCLRDIEVVDLGQLTRYVLPYRISLFGFDLKLSVFVNVPARLADLDPSLLNLQQDADPLYLLIA